MRIVRERIRKAHARFFACGRLPFMPEHGSAQKIIDFFRTRQVGIRRRLKFRSIGYATRWLFDLRQPRRAGILPVLNRRLSQAPER
jgi:hypothetical protein